jgi:hypothetical protein
MPATPSSGSASSARTTVRHSANHKDPPRAIKVPGLPPVPLPSTGTALYYGGIAALVAAELIDWPVALAVVVGHEVLTRRQKR